MIKILGNFESEEGKDVLKNLKIIYSTREGEVALDREFGINQDFLDEPWPQAQAMLAKEIINKTEKYEKRAKVESVDFNNENSTGKLKVEVKINVDNS